MTTWKQGIPAGYGVPKAKPAVSAAVKKSNPERKKVA
jgi:hypothetical protein